jgi:uncharacterized protein YjbI with pentapeptide repeats
LTRTNLVGADLREADLSGAYLLQANLRGANLAAADLCGARLEGANLHDVDLQAANLTGAILEGANPRGAPITEEQLDHIGSLEDALVPDGICQGQYAQVATLSKNLTQFGKPCILMSSLLFAKR